MTPVPQSMIKKERRRNQRIRRKQREDELEILSHTQTKIKRFLV